MSERPIKHGIFWHFAEYEGDYVDGDQYRRTVDELRGRIATLEAKLAEAKGRLRTTCQILVEAVGAGGPTSAEPAARKTVAKLAEVGRERDHYLTTFRHDHKGCELSGQNTGDRCAQCGLDIRDPIHTRKQEDTSA